MKRFFLVFSLISISLHGSYAYNGGIQNTFIPNEEMDALQDKSSLEYYGDKYNAQKATIDSYKRCATKNKYYMPGVADVDSDDCFDVLAEVEGTSSTAVEAYYVGNMSAAGDLRYFSAADSREKKGTGVFAADNYCNAAFVGSRAMRYDDMKYLIKNKQMPTLAHPVFVFDAIRNFEGTNQIRLKTGELSINGDGKNWNCNNYSSRSATSYSVRFKTNGSESKRFVTNVACDKEGYVICVKDQ